MTNISQIKVDSDWGQEAARINQNFQNMNTDLEKVKSATTKFRGYFTSETGLKQKYPSPKVGDTAWVGEPYPGKVYDVVTDGTWHNTDTAPDTESVELQDYATKEEFTELEGKVGGVGYVMCDTAAGTAAKVITVTGLTVLSTGIRLLVKMTNNNTASNATLNINGLGAKPLYYNNTRVSGDNAWETGEVIDVYYDGTNFYSGNFQGGSSEGGNLILEWNTDAATTRKQVKQSDRKSLLQISYKDADGNTVNEQYIGSTFTDGNWVLDNNWLKIATLKDVENVDLNTSFYIIDDEISKASTYIPLNRRKQYQLVQFKERLKSAIIITIDGVATSVGEFKITYNGSDNTVPITIDDDYNTILDKIVALSVEGLTITKIGNNAHISVANYEDTLTATYSVKSTGMSVNILTSRKSDMYIYRLYKYNNKGLTDSYYNNKGNWGFIAIMNPNALQYSNLGWSSSPLKNSITSFTQKEDNSYDFTVKSGNIKIYNDGVAYPYYINFGGIRFNVPVGYVLALHYNGLVDLIKYSEINMYPVGYLIYNNASGNTPRGLIVDYWEENQVQFNYTKNVLIGQNRLKCTYNTDGSLIIDRIDDGTYSNVIYLSYGNPVISVQITPTYPIQIPKYTALVYNITSKELIERKYSITNNPEYHNVPVASDEILLVANSVGRIQGGVLMPYIFNSRFYTVDRKLLPTPKRMRKGGPSQGMFIYGQNLCLCNASSDDHSSFVNNTIIDKDTFVNIKTVQHNFGHLNTVNYNASNDCLMFSDSAKAVFANHIYIIPNWSTYAESHDTWDFNEIEKVTIDIEWLYTELNEYKANPAWGPNWGNNDLIYVASKDNTVLRCIRLGKGTNQLDRGTYTPAEEDGYNGTYTVISTYTAEQTICVNGDSHIINGCFVTGARFGTEDKSGILALRIQDTNSIKPELWQIDQAMGDGQGLATTEDEFFFATDSYIYVWDLAKFNL